MSQSELQITKSAPQLGLLTSTSLVIGNMIGSGVFLLPVALAAYGSISLLGWIGSSIGAIVLALLFSKLCKLLPDTIGGPYAYTRAGLGDFAAFLVAWGYWISVWCSNAAIAVAFVSYLSVFFPILAKDPLWSAAAGLAGIWSLTWINIRGVKSAGQVQLITTILKIIPLVLISIVGLFYLDVHNFSEFNISQESNFGAITASVTLTLFAFIGLESATVPSESISNPEKTIPRATMIGTAVTIFIYVVGSITVMGMIPMASLKNSTAPFADAAALIWGEPARYWVAAGAVISTFGALNGYILLQGQMPLAAARDKLFPRIFNRLNKKGTPSTGIIISSVLISALLILNFTKGLNEAFTFMVLISTVSMLVPYLFSAASYGIFILQNKVWKKQLISQVVLAAIAFLFSLWAIVGSGEKAVYWGFIAILMGIPFYIWNKRSES